MSLIWMFVAFFSLLISMGVTLTIVTIGALRTESRPNWYWYLKSNLSPAIHRLWPSLYGLLLWIAVGLLFISGFWFGAGMPALFWTYLLAAAITGLIAMIFEFLDDIFNKENVTWVCDNSALFAESISSCDRQN